MLDLFVSSRSRLTIKQPIRHTSLVLTRVLTGVGNREIYRRLKVAEIRMDLLWICHFNEHFYSHPRCPREMIDSAIAARWEYQRDSKSLARLEQYTLCIRDRQTHTHTDTDTDRQTDTHTHTHTHTHAHTHKRTVFTCRIDERRRYSFHLFSVTSVFILLVSICLTNPLEKKTRDLWREI